jgi:hypothetical protein
VFGWEVLGESSTVDEREQHGERDAAQSVGRQAEGGEGAQVMLFIFLW